MTWKMALGQVADKFDTKLFLICFVSLCFHFGFVNGATKLTCFQHMEFMYLLTVSEYVLLLIVDYLFH